MTLIAQTVNNMSRKKKIYQLSNAEYMKLLGSGMFYEVYPEATGNYESDLKLSHAGKFKTEQDICKICNGTGELPNGGAGDTWSDPTCNCKKDE